MKELRSGKSVSGVKQSLRAVRDSMARTVYLARDADPALTAPIRALCAEKDVPVVDRYTMRELGQAVGIQVGTAAAALLKE